jgi:hypothetical protein
MAALTMIEVHLHQELHDRICANALDDGLSLAHYIALLLDQQVPRPGSPEFKIAAAVRKSLRVTH